MAQSLRGRMLQPSDSGLVCTASRRVQSCGARLVESSVWARLTSEHHEIVIVKCPIPFLTPVLLIGSCSDTTGSVHVQETCYADNTPGRTVEFDALQHRKYHAEVYFKHADCRVPSDSKTVLEKYQMSDPPRNPIAQRAYDEFVRGLEVIGAQEHMIHGAHGSGNNDQIEKEDQAAMLQELKKRLNFSGMAKPDDADLLRDLAVWERYKQLRADAPLRRRWYYSLKKRAISTSNDEFNVPGPNSYPNIRKGTFQLLTRPAERDFDFLKYLLRCLTVISMTYAFYAQVVSITKLCPDAYMCPMNLGIWPHRPAAAPPVAFRVKSDFTASLDYDYYHSVRASCKAGSSGCQTPGYRIQWPYMQLATESEGVSKFEIGVPAAIKGACERKSQGAKGWMWDHTTSQLLREYWDCGAKKFVQFEDTEGVPFHFQTGTRYVTQNSPSLPCLSLTFLVRVRVSRLVQEGARNDHHVHEKQNYKRRSSVGDDRLERHHDQRFVRALFLQGDGIRDLAELLAGQSCVMPLRCTNGDVDASAGGGGGAAAASALRVLVQRSRRRFADRCRVPLVSVLAAAPRVSGTRQSAQSDSE